MWIHLNTPSSLRKTQRLQQSLELPACSLTVWSRQGTSLQGGSSTATVTAFEDTERLLWSQNWQFRIRIASPAAKWNLWRRYVLTWSEAQRERISKCKDGFDAYQNPENNYKENSLWWEFYYLRLIPGEDPYATQWPAQSWDCQADLFHQYGAKSQGWCHHREAYINIFLNIDNQLLNKQKNLFLPWSQITCKPKPKSSEETPG